ncbi:unnamed protein product [Leuciscus chuanchicus]
MAGKIKLDEFITHKMDLEEINDAISLMKTGQWFGETPQGFITYTRCISNLNNGLQNRPGTLQRAKAYKHTEAD